VVWCNFDLARRLGFAVPSTNQMSPQLHEQLIKALSFRVSRRRSKVTGPQAITLHADRYGGEGLGPALGGGRSGFLSRGDLYLKGVGITPLFRHDDPSDLAHSHGGMQINDCLGEAVFGEVNQHLLSRGSTRILAVIDQGESVTYPYARVPIALAVRSGQQLRPGNLLSQQIPRRHLLDGFLRMTKETKQLVKHRVPALGMQPDIKATMLRIVSDHAQTSAELFRWRLLHGAVTASNLEMSGAALDLTTETSQPRTAPVCFALEDESFFGREHLGCARHLGQTYRALLRSIPQRDRKRLNAVPSNLVAAMKKAYAQSLQAQLLSATGLKTELAERILRDQPELAQRFAEVIMAMAELRNPGNIEMARRVVESVAVLDVYNLLREFPRAFFARPKARHLTFIRSALKPIFKGNRLHVRKKRRVINSLSNSFADAYRELMLAAEACAADYYEDLAGMQRSITARAAFENEPIDLFRTTLYREFDDAIETYKSDGRAAVVHQVVDQAIQRSWRKVDDLLSQGELWQLRDGSIELERKSIAGVTYAITARNDERVLTVRVPLSQRDGDFEIGLPNWPRLTRRQIKALSYRFTTDNWTTIETRNLQLEKDLDGSLVVTCESAVNLPLVGRVEGVFFLSKGRDSWVSHEGAISTGYAFALPDKRELAQLMARSRD
jgi:hypothetical protein